MGNIVNATLAFADERGRLFPYLAEGLPELNTPSWRVFSDGKMETTYRLRANLQWHDGVPLTADDFVFAWHVYATPAFGFSSSVPTSLIDEVTAPDRRTLIIRWRGAYPQAGQLGNGFPPLPQHLLAEPYEQLQADAFVNIPFWTDEYIGTGPYKVDQRVPGVSFEGSAFDQFVFGRPKIERVRIVYMADPNTVVANLLSGEAHYSVESLLFGEDGDTLERGWGQSGGTVFWEALSSRHVQVQVRPDFAVPAQLVDVRVRRAFAHLLDKEATFDVVTGGHGVRSDTFTHPSSDFYDTVNRSVNHYVHDPRVAQRLFEEAGFSRGANGAWATPNGDRFGLEFWFIAGTANEREATILVQQLRDFGIDAVSRVWGVQNSSNEARSKFAGLNAGAEGGSTGFLTYQSSNVPGPDNRWVGGSRGGWSSPEIDRLAASYNVTLDSGESIKLVAEMERIITDQLPTIFLYYTPRVVPHVAALRGPVQRLVPEAGPGVRNIYQWDWAS